VPATRLSQPWPAGPPDARRGARTLVFDVLGTVVDESASITELLTAAWTRPRP
jgi:hypothetical protein